MTGMRQGPLIWFFGLPLLSGLLMWSAWPPLHTALSVFIGLVPLFIADETITAKYNRFTGFKVWLSAYTGLFIWNLLTTWWVTNASEVGGILAVTANPALMSIPFMLARRIRLRFGTTAWYLAFVVFWMSFEYIHLRWELTWPWLTLGNVFAAQYTWVQWYDITGVFGGTLWICLGNLVGYRFIKSLSIPTAESSNKNIKGISFRILALFMLLIAVPIAISKYQYAHYTEKGQPVDVTVLQPNFDPVTEKFVIPYKVQMDKMIGLSMQKTNAQTDFLLWPETAIQDVIWLDKLAFEKPVRDLKRAFDSLPNLTCVVGINGYEKYTHADDATATARTLIYGQGGPGIADTMWYDVYNTALAINREGPLGYYHKSKLVPGAERWPYPEQLKWLNRFSISLGGVEGTLAIQKDRTVFFNQDGVGIAPVICYESVFGEYVGDYIKKGAGIIGIITNDGWWGDTDGYKQHCMYASLRSIETRRCVARSANTGISCFINQRGDITQPTGWREDAVISASLPVNTALTFYTQHGDFLARWALWIAGGMLLVLAYYRLREAIKK